MINRLIILINDGSSVRQLPSEEIQHGHTACSALSAISRTQDFFNARRPPFALDTLRAHALNSFPIETNVHYGLRYKIAKLSVV